ncbi:helix-turn-helix transcriptional regulator [Auritidibacter sp. NML100628]|nr:helix-turn-helix transcriptional regulator [Auritidibacter sp. NML100628]PXA77900.1 hypothetical protein DCC24_03130 [Auritidibacter sp. NML100628]
MRERTIMAVNAENLSQYLDAMGMSQRELARRAGISHTRVQQLLNVKSPSTVQLGTAVKIERALGAPPRIIFIPKVCTITTTAA